MKNFLKKTFLLLAVPMAITLFSASDDPCPEEDDPLAPSVVFANPEDPTSFYSCSNGVPILMHCPDGLYFNDDLDVCDWWDEGWYKEEKKVTYLCTTTSGYFNESREWIAAGKSELKEGTYCKPGSTVCRPNNPCF